MAGQIMLLRFTLEMMTEAKHYVLQHLEKQQCTAVGKITAQYQMF